MMKILAAALLISAPAYATEFPQLPSKTGAGITVITENQQLVLASGPERCLASVTDSELSLLTSPPDFGRFQSSIQLQGATVVEVEPKLTVYSTNLTNGSCPSSGLSGPGPEPKFLAGKQVLIVDTTGANPVLILKTTTQCDLDGQTAERIEKRVCNFGF